MMLVINACGYLDSYLFMINIIWLDILLLLITTVVYLHVLVGNLVTYPQVKLSTDYDQFYQSGYT